MVSITGLVGLDCSHILSSHIGCQNVLRVLRPPVITLSGVMCHSFAQCITGNINILADKYSAIEFVTLLAWVRLHILKTTVDLLILGCLWAITCQEMCKSMFTSKTF